MINPRQSFKYTISKISQLVLKTWGPVVENLIIEEKNKPKRKS